MSAAALLLGGCKSSSATANKGPSTVSVDTCAPNVGNTAGNAVGVSSGQAYQGKICYEATSNWYAITVPQGDTLLDVSGGYPLGTATAVTLDLKVYFQTSATELTQLHELTAPSSSDAGINSIRTTVLASQPGTYYVQASDAQNVSFDATHSYTLELTTAADPDTHEPNDSPDASKPADGKPGWLAYLGDLDVFTTTVTSANSLLSLKITNPATAPAAIDYSISTNGAVVASGTASPSATPLTSVTTAATTGAYYVTLSYPQGTTPDRSSADGYTLALSTMANPDEANNNHTIATATCPGGGTGPCSTTFSGTAVTLPTQTGYIAVQGQHDYYRVDVTSGAPLVLEMDLTSAASTPVQYAIDLLTPDPKSSCTLDSDCQALDEPCSSASDCEISHACLSAGDYGFCPTTGVACTLCEGAGICITPSGGGSGVCAAAQYLSAFSPSGAVTGSSSVSTAQPLFQTGAYYINVHDAQYQNVDETNPYSLTLKMVPEPDPYDQSTTPAQRNNFYNPYPSSTTDLTPSSLRAVNITAQIDAGTAVTGYISYETDEDWFTFDHPCPGENCGIDFQWIQPGPSNVQVAYFMLNNDLSVHESFGYVGTTATSSLTGPTTGTFANADCTQCSFASSTATSSSGPYMYFLRIADLGQKHWDYSSKGQYSFKVTAITAGCPAACDESSSGTCVCFCASTMSCPSPTQ